MSKILIVLTLFCTSIAAHAIQVGSVYVGAAVFSHGIARVAANETGDVGLLGPMFYPLTAQTAFSLGDGWAIAPQIGYTLFGSEIFPKVSPDGGERFSYMLINLPLVKSLSDFGGDGFDWSIGPGILFYTIKGQGGSTVQNNGTTQTTFGLPDRSSTTKTVTLNLGAAYNSGAFKFGLDTVMEGLLTNKRTFSILFNLSYNLIGKY